MTNKKQTLKAQVEEEQSLENAIKNDDVDIPLTPEKEKNGIDENKVKKLQEEVIYLNSVVETLQSELKEEKENYLRGCADIENQRKRLIRDKNMLYDQILDNVLERFFIINDDMQRSIVAMKNIKKGEKDFMKGIELVAEKMGELLSNYNVNVIDEINVPFDVNKHIAMMQKESKDKKQKSDIIMEVIERGYCRGDRTLRYAKVIVSK